MKIHRLTRILCVAALLLLCITTYASGAELPEELPNTDPGNPLVLGTELGMNEKEVRDALEEYAIDDLEKADGTNPSLPKQFMLQSRNLAQALGGAFILWFDDGKMLTRIYTNSNKLTIKSKNGDLARVGDKRLAFDRCLEKHPKVGLLPSKIEAAIYGVSGVNFMVVSSNVPGTIAAWAVEMREYSAPLTPIRN